MFPSSIDFKINYLYDDKFILRELNKVDIKVNDCLVKPFAQVDVINTFLYSVDSEFENEIINFVNGVKLNYINHIKKIISFIENNDNVPDDIKNQLLSDILNLEVENEDLDILKKLNNLKINHYLPIVKSIASLPKEDLSNLAESLIKITSLKRKHQNDLQTVGGPVDVAIITKGDGFIWTKRKHYFDANLNPQFFDMK